MSDEAFNLLRQRGGTGGPVSFNAPGHNG